MENNIGRVKIVTTQEVENLKKFFDEWARVVRKILSNTARTVRQVLHRHNMMKELGRPYAWKYYGYYMGVNCGIIKQRKCKGRRRRKRQ